MASSPTIRRASSISAALLGKARAWPGLEGMDLAKEVSCRQMYRWSGGRWALGSGYAEGEPDEKLPHVVAIDYGSKRNIFRNLADEQMATTNASSTYCCSRRACPCGAGRAGRGRIRAC